METQEDAYRENPLLKELEQVKLRLIAAEKSAEYWEKRYDEHKAWATTELSQARSHEAVKSWIKFFHWGVVVPSWFLLTVAALVFPVYAVILRHVNPDWLWASLLGIISAVILVMYAHGQSE